MRTLIDATCRLSASKHLRASTEELHRQLERRFDAVAELSDPLRRPLVISRYAALHIPADRALEGELGRLEGLDFAVRRRTALLEPFISGSALPPFPQPRSRAEALGLLYVLEGSALGGRLILRELAARGVDAPELAFLDPYGSDTGRLWRNFRSVVDREVSGDTHLEDATRGALRGFRHAEMILCGSLT